VVVYCQTFAFLDDHVHVNWSSDRWSRKWWSIGRANPTGVTTGSFFGTRRAGRSGPCCSANKKAKNGQSPRFGARTAVGCTGVSTNDGTGRGFRIRGSMALAPRSGIHSAGARGIPPQGAARPFWLNRFRATHALTPLRSQLPRCIVVLGDSGKQISIARLTSGPSGPALAC